MKRRLTVFALAAAGVFGCVANLRADGRQEAINSVTFIYQNEEAALNHPDSDVRGALAHYTEYLRDRLAAGFERGRRQYGDTRFAISILSSMFDEGVLTVTWRLTGVTTTGALPTQITVDCEDQWRNEGGNWVAFAFRRLTPVQTSRAEDSAAAQRMRYSVYANSLQRRFPLP